MEITQQADYAVRAVLALALRPDGQRTPSGDIARQQTIPPAFLAKILARLAAEDIVSTQRGVNGGVTLARPAHDISLLQVIEAIDGPLTLNRCTLHSSVCPRDATCAVHPVWVIVRSEVRERLDGIRFDTLANAARIAVSGDAGANGGGDIQTSEVMPHAGVAHAIDA